MPTHTSQAPTIKRFLNNNPDIHLPTADLQDPAQLAQLNWEGVDRKETLAELKARQRLLRLHGDPAVAQHLRACGFASAHHVAALSEDRFAERVANDMVSTEQARAAHRRAVNVVARTNLRYASLKQAVAAPHFETTQAYNVSAKAKEHYRALPGYPDLFGSLDYIACGEGRSLLSPAAYFVDLMRLIDDHVTAPNRDTIPEGFSLQERRPDLWEIPLDAAATDDEVPYLRIANRVMANTLSKTVEQDALAYLHDQIYPFNLPFSAPLEEIRAYLAHFDVKLTALYETVQPDTAGDAVAQARLGLSPEQAAVITTSDAGPQSLKRAYGLAKQPTSKYMQGLDRVETFLATTGLTRSELDDLVYQDLPHTRSQESAPFETTVLSLDAAHEQYVEIPYAKGLNPSDRFTLSAWVKVDAIGERQDIISFYTPPRSGASGYCLYLDETGKFSFAVAVSNSFPIENGPTVEKGRWTHICVVYGSNYIVLYADGEPTKKPTHKPIVANRRSALRIGGSIFGNETFKNGFTGQIAQVQIWNDALSPNDVKLLMSRPPSDNESRLLGYWPLNDGSGRKVTDQSKKKHDGRLKSANSDTLPTWETVTDTKWGGNDTSRNDVDPDAKLRHAFFINQGLDNGKSIDIRINRDDPQAAYEEIVGLSLDTLDRLHRFIRLAQHLGWSFADLDWALRSLAPTPFDLIDLDSQALAHLAQLYDLKERYGLAIDVLCSFWSDLKTVGGDSTQPHSLFDQLFNKPNFLAGSSRYQPSYTANPSYSQTAIRWDTKVRTGNHGQIRTRLAGAINVSDDDLTRILDHMLKNDLFGLEDAPKNPKPAEGEIWLTVQNLTRLYRFGKIPAVLGLSVVDYLVLTDLLTASGQLASPQPTSVADVVTLSRWVDWLQSNTLDVPQVNYIVSGASGTGSNLGFDEADIRQMLQRLVETANDWRIGPTTFVRQNIDAEMSARLFKHLVAQGYIDENGIVVKPNLPFAEPAAVLLGQDDPPTQHPNPYDVKNVALRSGESQQYIKVEPDPALDFSQIDTWTLETWIKADNLGQGHPTLFSAGFLRAALGIVTGTGEDAGKLVCTLNGETQYLSSKAVAAGTWQHVAVTYRKQGPLTFFIDGAVCGSVPAPSTVTEYSDAGFTIGSSSPDPSDALFKGLMADVRIWNTVRSGNEIRSTMHRRLDGSEYGLLAYWPLDSATDKIVADRSGNKHDGEMVNAGGQTSEYEVWPPAPGLPINLYVAAAVDTVYQHARSQVNGTVDALSTFFHTTTDPLPALLNLTAVVQGIDDWLPFLLSDKTGRVDFVAHLTRLLPLAQALRLTGAEVRSLLEHPESYGIDGEIERGFSFNLEQIRTLTTFKLLVAGFNDTNHALLGLWAIPAEMTSERQAALAKLAGWDLAQLQALLAVPAFAQDDGETVAGVARLKAVFDLAATLGVDVPTLLSLAPPSDKDGGDLFAAYGEQATLLLNAINARYEQSQTWTDVLESFNSRFDERVRDALVGFMLWDLQNRYGTVRSFAEPRDLYEYLLLDVEMSRRVRISPLKQALNSAQLYVQRCRMNLEPGVTSRIPDAWWAWMEHYRVWQANRSVFLYPENYLDPSLRKERTPLYQALQDELSQQEISDASVNQAYQNYFDGFATAMKLQIVASYYAAVPHPGADNPDNVLFLFGRTRSAPYSYQLRTALFSSDGKSVVGWTPWTPIELAMHVAEITPVYAFNRLFLFWVEQNQTTATDPADPSRRTSVTRATVKYSFRDSNGNWVAPRVLVQDQPIHAGATLGPDFEPWMAETDVTQSCWQKVQALVLPQHDSQEAKIFVLLGSVYPVDGDLALHLPALTLNSGLVSTREPVVLKRASSSFLALQVAGDTLTSFMDDRVLLGNGIPLEFLSTESVADDDSPQLTVARHSLAATALGDIAIFAGGREGDGAFHDTVDGFQYDGRNEWSSIETDRLREACDDLVGITVGDVALFAGGHTDDGSTKSVNVFRYDADKKKLERVQQEDRTPELSVSRYNLAAAVAGPLAVFAGGKDHGSDYHRDVDVFVYQDGRISRQNGLLSDDRTLARSRSDLAAASVGNLLIFAGGDDGGEPCDDIDIFSYDAGEGRLRKQKHTLKLSQARWGLAAATLGNFVLFAGGRTGGDPDEVDTVDIFTFDPATGRLSRYTQTYRLKKKRSSLGATAVGNVAIFYGGRPAQGASADGWETFTYDPATGELKHEYHEDTGTDLYVSYLAGTSVGDQALFGGGLSNTEFLFQIDDKNGAVVSALQDRSDMNTPLSTDPPDALQRAFQNHQRALNPLFSVNSIVYEKAWAIDNSTTKYEIHKRNNKLDVYSPDTSTAQSSLHIIRVGKGTPLLSKVSRYHTAVRPVSNQPEWFIFDNGDETFLVRPEGKPAARLSQKLATESDSQGRTVLSYGGEGNGGDRKFTFARLTSHAVEPFSDAILAGGPAQLLTLHAQHAEELPFTRLEPDMNRVVPPHDDTLDFSSAVGPYLWEIYFHIPFLVARTLNLNQQFEAARTWYHYVFNPTLPAEADDSVTSPYWQFRPFRHHTLESLNAMLTSPSELQVYADDPFDPDAIARLRIGAYEKAIVMNYIDNLLDWGDFAFAQDSWESIVQARMLYVFAWDLLGRKPALVGSPQPLPPQTFRTLQDGAHDADGVPPFLVELEHQAGDDDDRLHLTGAPFNAVDGYFCMPENDQFVAYWDRVTDRLYKIRHGEDIAGVYRELEQFQPRLDPMALVQARAAGKSLDRIGAGLGAETPHYRFDYLIERAKSMTATLIQLGSQLLSALEKKDAEQLARLQNSHQQVVLNTTAALKQSQIEDAHQTLSALEQSLESARFREQYYRRLAQKGLSASEKTALTLLYQTFALQTVASEARTLSVAAYLLPTIFGLSDGGSHPGDAVNAGAQIAESTAALLNQASGLAGTQAMYQRRAQEWQMQQRLAGYDIQSTQMQIQGARARLALAQQDLALQQTEVAHARSIDAYFKSKFSDEELYQWMAERIAGVYFQSYGLAFDLALSAEKAYQYERNTDQIFISYGDWDSLRKGLLAGEGLMLRLQQMEKAYIDHNERYLEIEKTLSLLAHDPKAFLDLKATGRCTFSLGEILFDLDYPGHYNRQIKSIALTIPAVVGPYQNIQASLIQQSNRVLLQPDLNAVKYLAGEPSVHEPDSTTVRANWRPLQQVALSRGVNDTGLFELNFRDERYLPFEGTGAISTWELNLPRTANRFHFDTISDVIVRIHYTALPGGESFTDQVTDWVMDKYVGYLALNMRQQFSTDWYAFIHQKAGAPLTFKVSPDLFPFPPPQKEIALPSAIEAHLILEWADGVKRDSNISLKLKLASQDGALDFNFDPTTEIVSRAIVDEDVDDFWGAWSIKVAEDPDSVFAPGKLRNLTLILPYVYVSGS